MQRASERIAKEKATKNEETKTQKKKNRRGLWKAWKAKSRLPPLSTAPWKSRQTRARFPHSHSSDDYAVGKWKTKSRFPTLPPRSLMFETRTENARASPSALCFSKRRLPFGNIIP